MLAPTLDCGDGCQSGVDVRYLSQEKGGSAGLLTQEYRRLHTEYECHVEDMNFEQIFPADPDSQL
jgi:hypothetical protein